MFRPRASSTYNSALSAIRTQKLPAACSSSGRIASATAASRIVMSLLRLSIIDSSGTVRHAFTQQAGGPQREHHDQDDEREDVRIVTAQDAAGQRAEVARADRLDQPQEHATQHGAGQVADAAEH